MENISESTSQPYRLYSDRAIFIATVLGGPLVAGYLVSTNFNLTGERKKAKTAWIISIIASIIIFGSIFLIPAIEKAPNFLIPLIYGSIAQALVKKYQGAMIEHHIQDGGTMHSSWRAAGISIIGAAITLAILLVIVYFIYGIPL